MGSQIESFLAWGDAHPQLFAVLITTIVWPTITGLVSLAQDWIKARAPRLWDFLQRTGFDALGTIRAHWPKRLPPPPSSKGPGDAPPGGTAKQAAELMKRTALEWGMVLSLVVGSVALTGCAALSAALPEIVSVITKVADASIILDQIKAFVDSYFAAHPDAGKQRGIDAALTKTRLALLTAQRSAQGAEHLDQKQTDAAFADFRAAYEELTQLLAGIDGLHVAKSGEALQARPGELVIPTPLAMKLEVSK